MTREGLNRTLQGGVEVNAEARIEEEEAENLLSGVSALSLAILFNGDPDVVQLLLDAGDDVSNLTAGGYTPLIVPAAAGADIDVGRMLLDHGSDLDARTRDGMSVPTTAAESSEKTELSGIF